MKLWIDDERFPPTDWMEGVYIAQSSIQAINYLRAWNENGQKPEIISFDHDLGYVPGFGGEGIRDDTTRPVLLWMIENDVWPDEIRFHTANPVGMQWLRGMAQRYAPGWVDVR